MCGRMFAVMVEVEEFPSKDFLCTERACRAELGFTAGFEIQGDPVKINIGRKATFVFE
jgi:hypothetical protein